MKITRKKMRELYPYAVEGHRKNCTCFSCGRKRYDMWKADNPTEAQRQELEAERKWNKKVAQAKEQDHNSKLKMERVLTGNKYYKERDEMSYYDFVEYKIVEEPMPCYSHPEWSHPDGCDCERPLHKRKVVSNEKDLEIYQEKDTVHCSMCYQRLGNACMPCPLCVNSGRVYGTMLKNPMDRRWTLPRYSGEKDKKENITTHAESGLKSRMKSYDNEEDLI